MADLQGLISLIEDLTDEEPVFGGGGKGQTVTSGGRTAKGTSRVGAAQAWLDAWDAEAVPPISRGTVVRVLDPEPEPDARPTIEDAMAIVRRLFPDVEEDTADEDTAPGPVWSSDGLELLRVVPCVGECMSGQSDLCECKCQGDNHGIGSAAFLAGWTSADTRSDKVAVVQAIRPVVLGSKQCACGCGETTLRRFVPGHDARYHGRIKREAQAAARGITVAEVPAALNRERRARAKAAREIAKA